MAAWVASLWVPTWAVWSGDERVDYYLWGGTAIRKSWGINPTHVPETGFSTFGPVPPVWDWPPWPHRIIFPGPRTTWVMPMWPLILVAGATFAGTHLTARRRRRWGRDGKCLACGYDLTGIDGVCPECGGTG